MILLVALARLIAEATFTFLASTLIWFMWPIVVEGALPGLVADGSVACEISWITAVAIVAIFYAFLSVVRVSKLLSD